jgi:hypothetical protein
MFFKIEGNNVILMQHGARHVLHAHSAEDARAFVNELQHAMNCHTGDRLVAIVPAVRQS